MPLKILHAADASGAADDLAKQLRRWRNRDVTLLLTSKGLDDAPGKNDIIREALAAANDATLLVVPLDEAAAPVGTRDSPCVQWRPDASAAEVHSAIRSLVKKTKRGTSLGWLFAVLGVAALAALVFGQALLIRGSMPMSPPPMSPASPEADVLNAINGRWASSAEECKTDYFDFSATNSEVRVTHSQGSEALPVFYVDNQAGTITVRDSARSLFTYRVTGETLTLGSDQSTTLVRCPAVDSMATGSQSAEFDELRDSVGQVASEVSALSFSIQDVQENLRTLEDRLNFVLMLMGAFLLFSILSLLGLRLPRRRKTAKAPESISGPLVVASYARKDGEAVDEVVKQIERGGVTIWMDKADIGAGTTWSEEIVRAIRNSRGLILFCSEHAFQSDHVLRELNLADSCRKPVYPVLLEAVTVPDSFLYYLSTRQILDVQNDPDWQSKLATALTPSVRQVEGTKSDG